MPHLDEVRAAWREEYRHLPHQTAAQMAAIFIEFLKLRHGDLSEELSHLSRGSLIQLLAALRTAAGPEPRPPEPSSRAERELAPIRARHDVSSWALDRIRDATDSTPRQAARGKTFISYRNEKTFHLRTARSHPRGHDEHSYWFSLARDKWTPGEVFVLACDTDALLIVPVDDWMPYKDAMPVGSPSGRVVSDPEKMVLQPTVWRTADGRYELRVGGLRIDAAQWIDAFDVL